MKKIFSITAVLAMMFSLSMNAALKIGDNFVEGGRTYQVIGVNLISNPSFDSTVVGGANPAPGWVTGAGGAFTTSTATRNVTGGVDGGPFLVPITNTGVGGAASIGTGWAIQSGKTYVFDHYTKKPTETTASREGYIVTSMVNAVGTTETKVMRTDTINANNAWTLNRMVFTNTVPYGYIQFRARWLNGRIAFDDFLLAEVKEKADNSFLLNLIASCEEIVGGKETAAFEAAIAAAKLKTNSPDATVLNAAMAELQERLLDYRIANAAEGYIVDVTGRYVKNADFTSLLTDWNCGTVGVTNGINPIIYSHFGAATREMELQNGTTAVSNNYCQQTITHLRKGYYRFGADMVAWNNANNTDSIYGTYLMCNGALTSVSTHGAAGTNPKKFYVEGVVTDSSIIVGMKTVGTNATMIYMDNVTLEYMGFDASIYMTSLRDKVKNYIVVSGSTLLPGVLSELKKAVVASETETIDEDTLAVFYENLDNAYKQATKSLTMMADLQAQILDLNNLLITYSEWPGFGAAQATLVAANGLLTSGPADVATSKYADLVNMIATMSQAKKNYILSQPASAATPANLTLLVQTPSFRADGQENISTATLSSTGWATANVTNGGDYRTGFNQNNTCYNSWSTSFTSMNLYQNITGMPAGIYTVNCIAMTQPYDLNDQHAYVSSSLTTAVSPYMQTATWYDATTSPSGSGIWEPMATQKVVLLAGDTLRIGFASSHNASAVDGTGAARGQNGWFSVTDFQVKYYGTVGTDAVVLGDVQAADALKSTVALLGDRAQVAAYVATATDRLSANAGYAKVYESLNAATKLAKASILARTNFLASNYAKLSGMAAADTLQADIDALYTAAISLTNDSLAKATATYANLTSLDSKLAAYPTYAAAYTSALAYIASVSSNAYVVKIQNKMAAQKAALSADLATPATITAYVADLNNSIADAKLSFALAGGNNQDLTYLIINQPLAATSGTVAPTGWTVTGSKDAITKVGQYMDDSATKRYFDTYASGAGILFTGKQAIKVPNGTYTVKAIARTPATGVFIYATGIQNYFTEAPMHTYDKLLRNSTGLSDSTGTVTDTYGPIWEAAADGSAIKLANSGKGRGWGQITVDDVVVTNHEITIGFSSDSTFTGKPFKGTWFSVVDFTLTLKTMGDNAGWVITGLKDIQGTKAVARVEYFMLSGVRVATLVKGFNIVKTTYSDGTVKVTKIFQQ
jgi:hypothetical protein